MNRTTLVLALLFVTSLVRAETVYTNDTQEFFLRAGEGTRFKVLETLPAGAELTVIRRNARTGFTKVRTAAGIEGYIVSRNLSATPSVKQQSDELTAKINALTEENNVLKSELGAVKGDGSQTLTPNQTLLDERNRARQELAELKAASSQTVQLKEQRDQLQARNIAVERELEQLKRENQGLNSTANQDWFLYGGALALGGVLLGFLLPKLSWRRRSSGWDTF